VSNRLFFALSALGGLVLASVIYLISPGATDRTGSESGVAMSDGPRHDSYYHGIQRAAPAVVSVYSSEIIYRASDEPVDFSNPGSAPGSNSIAPLERYKTDQGSGVIISDEGYVLTNNHLIKGADNINVALADGRLFQARKVGADVETDLAVIKIDSPEALPSCSPENDSTLMVGDIVLAIGNPFGVGQTVTQGIVSATSRHVSGASQLQNFVQIDAAINPGNSGGALINPQGDLVGINTAVFSRDNGAQGIGFAIPSELIRVAVPQIIEHGRVIRGWLGVGADNLHLHPDLYRISQRGAVITGVFRGSPAEQSGLRHRDIITELDGKPVTSATELMKMISSKKPGMEVQLSGMRNKETFAVTISLAERPVFDTSGQ